MTRAGRSALPEVWQRRARRLVAPACLAALIAALHGRSVSYGLFMDDYAHYRQLRAADWSLRGLTDACRLELVGGVLESWFLPECTLRFFRPVAFGLMKLAYAVCGWRAGGMHVASLLWHLTAATLLYALLRRLGVGAPPAWAAAALFAIHPGHVATVQWIAAQSELMVTTFALAAALAFEDIAGGADAPVRPERVGPPAANLGATRSVPTSGDRTSSPPPASFRRRPGRRAWIGAAVVGACFALALGCRENAIVLPAVLAAVVGVRAGAWRRSAPVLGLMLLLAGGYAALRHAWLGGTALPPRPYVVPPTDADFLPYVAGKLCYYLLAEFALIPCVPIGGLHYLRAHPWLFYGSAAAVAGALLWSARLPRNTAGRWGAAWLILCLGPVLPAFESPHHLYLPGVGWALIAGGLLDAWLRGGRNAGGARRLRAAAAACTLTIAAVAFATLTWFYGLAFDTARRVEQRVVDEVLSAPVPVRDGDTLYFANLPLIAHYVGPAVEHHGGRSRLRAVVLTWAPRVLGMATPAELTRQDDSTYELRIEGDRYFAGPIGRLVAEAAGGARPFDPGPVSYKNGLQVKRMEGDDDGIRALRFRFDPPPGSPGVHLFFGSRVRWAYQVRG